MKPRRMQPGIMWAVLNQEGKRLAVLETRSAARKEAAHYAAARVVRVRVTEAP